MCRTWILPTPKASAESGCNCEIFTIIINNSFFISSFSWPNLVSLLFLVLVLLLHSLCFLDLGSVSVYHVAHPFCKSLRRGDPNLCKPWDNQRAQNEFIKRLFFWNFLSYPLLYTSWLSRLRQRQVDSCICTWPAWNRTLHCGAFKRFKYQMMFGSSEVGEIDGFFPGYPCDIIYDIS